MVMAEIHHQGGPMAHQLPLQNHRGGLVQPSLVMNHHHVMDMDCHQTGLEILATNISKCEPVSLTRADERILGKIPR